MFSLPPIHPQDLIAGKDYAEISRDSPIMHTFNPPEGFRFHYCTVSDSRRRDAEDLPEARSVKSKGSSTPTGDNSRCAVSIHSSAKDEYDASALGFGGPSDWEHFEDYGGEEIDDTDLYIRPKVDTVPSPDTAPPLLPVSVRVPDQMYDGRPPPPAVIPPISNPTPTTMDPPFRNVNSELPSDLNLGDIDFQGYDFDSFLHDIPDFDNIELHNLHPDVPESDFSESVVELGRATEDLPEARLFGSKGHSAPASYNFQYSSLIHSSQGVDSSESNRQANKGKTLQMPLTGETLDLHADGQQQEQQDIKIIKKDLDSSATEQGPLEGIVPKVRDIHNRIAKERSASQAGNRALWLWPKFTREHERLLKYEGEEPSFVERERRPHDEIRIESGKHEEELAIEERRLRDEIIAERAIMIGPSSRPRKAPSWGGESSSPTDEANTEVHVDIEAEAEVEGEVVEEAGIEEAEGVEETADETHERADQSHDLPESLPHASDGKRACHVSPKTSPPSRIHSTSEGLPQPASQQPRQTFECYKDPEPHPISRSARDGDKPPSSTAARSSVDISYFPREDVPANAPETSDEYAPLPSFTGYTFKRKRCKGLGLHPASHPARDDERPPSSIAAQSAVDCSYFPIEDIPADAPETIDNYIPLPFTGYTFERFNGFENQRVSHSARDDERPPASTAAQATMYHISFSRPDCPRLEPSGKQSTFEVPGNIFPAAPPRPPPVSAATPEPISLPVDVNDTTDEVDPATKRVDELLRKWTFLDMSGKYRLDSGVDRIIRLDL